MNICEIREYDKKYFLLMNGSVVLTFKSSGGITDNFDTLKDALDFSECLKDFYRESKLVSEEKF